MTNLCPQQVLPLPAYTAQHSLLRVSDICFGATETVKPLDVEAEEKLLQYSKIVCSLSDLCPWILLDLCDMWFKEKLQAMVII